MNEGNELNLDDVFSLGFKGLRANQLKRKKAKDNGKGRDTSNDMKRTYPLT